MSDDRIEKAARMVVAAANQGGDGGPLAHWVMVLSDALAAPTDERGDEVDRAREDAYRDAIAICQRLSLEYGTLDKPTPDDPRQAVVLAATAASAQGACERCEQEVRKAAESARRAKGE